MSKTPGLSEHIGYGRPPRTTQFKPGQSGNPKGRPPKCRNRKRILEDLLFEQVTVKRGSNRVRCTRLEVMILAAVKKAADGDSRAFRLVSEWAERFEAERPNPDVHYGLLIHDELLPQRSDFPAELHGYWKYFFEALEELEASEPPLS